MINMRSFILSLKNEQNASLIEAILAGQKAIFEDGALQRFNQHASEIASNYGNNVLAFLQTSSNELASRFTEDDEEELDSNRNTCNVPKYVPNMKHTYEEKIGYSFTDAPDIKNTEYKTVAKIAVANKPVNNAIQKNRYIPPVITDTNSSFSNRFS